VVQHREAYDGDDDDTDHDQGELQGHASSATTVSTARNESRAARRRARLS
jgi:hypothetical protein